MLQAQPLPVPSRVPLLLGTGKPLLPCPIPIPSAFAQICLFSSSSGSPGTLWKIQEWGGCVGAEGFHQSSSAEAKWEPLEHQVGIGLDIFCHFSIATEEQELNSSWAPSSLGYLVILGIFLLEGLSCALAAAQGGGFDVPGLRKGR